MRALAVLVVATPCPLILAAPIALVSGVSRAARRGVIMKGGGALEGLGRARTVLLDKTGTLTRRAPAVELVVASAGSTADACCGSPRRSISSRRTCSRRRSCTAPSARAAAARARRRVEERPGAGIEGTVDGHRVAVGSRVLAARRGFDPAPARRAARADAGAPGLARVLVGVDGRLAGAIVMADRVRDDAAALARRAARRRHRARRDRHRRRRGDRRRGRRAAPASTAVLAERTPEEKLAVVRACARGRRSGPW